MKKIITILIALIISMTVLAQAPSISDGEMIDKPKNDTAIVIQKTDSLAVSILKTYDENSKRRTGVPLSIEHYDKAISFNAEQNDVLVSYSFNRVKFFGPTGAEIIVEDIDKYPYCFDIIYDFKTNKTYSQFDELRF